MQPANHPTSDTPAGLSPAAAVDRFAAPPDGYFDGLNAAISARLAGETPLRGALADPAARFDLLPAPAGYFASLPGRIVSHVQSFRPSPLARLSELLAAPSLRIALPVVLAGVMIGTGWYVTPDPAAQQPAAPLAASADALPKEAIMAELTRDLDHVESSLLVEYSAPAPAAATPKAVATPVNLDEQAMADYLASTATTTELIAALEAEASR